MFNVQNSPIKLIISIILMYVVFASFLVNSSSIVNAQAAGELKAICNKGDAKDSALCIDYKDGQKNSKNDNPLLDTLNTVVDIIAYLAGILAVIMVIFGGFRYIKSGGDSSKISDAKNTIIYALVGIVVVILARQLILFVLNRLL